MSHRAAAWSALTLATWILAGGTARADDAMPTCEELATQLGATPLYVTGSSAADPLMVRLGEQLLAKKQIALIYKPTASCTAISAITDDADKKGCANGRCITGMAQFMSYRATDGSTTPRKLCTLNNQGTHLDVALSDVHYETCTKSSMPGELAWFRGPAVAMTFAVPAWLKRPGAAQQPTGWPEYISDDEAYSVFGLTCGGGVEPWTDTRLHFTRTRGSGTAEILSRVMGVPVEMLWGREPFHDDSKSGAFAVRDALIEAAAQQKSAIGFLPASILGDAPTGQLKPLAFRAHGQRFAFGPDSSPGSGDMLNVRKGRYVPFGYLHLFIRRTDATQTQPARVFYELFTGLQTLNSFDLRDAIIQSHYIPDCAMEVERTSEHLDESGYFNELKPYKPTPYKCDCFFQSRLSTDPNFVPFGCTTCTTDTECEARMTSKTKCVDNFCTE